MKDRPSVASRSGCKLDPTLPTPRSVIRRSSPQVRNQTDRNHASIGSRRIPTPGRHIRCGSRHRDSSAKNNPLEMSQKKPESANESRWGWQSSQPLRSRSASGFRAPRQGDLLPWRKVPMNESYMHLKVCEGCGRLWARSHAESDVYCRGCREHFAEFPAPLSRRMRGRPRTARCQQGGAR